MLIRRLKLLRARHSWLLCLIVATTIHWEPAHAQSEAKTKAENFSGVVYDQDGKPLSDVALTIRVWKEEDYSDREINSETNYFAKTDRHGQFSMIYSMPTPKWGRAGIKSVSASKAGYQEDGAENDYMWRPFGTGTAPQWTMHLVSKRLMNQQDLRRLDFSSIPFSSNGVIGLNLVDGTISHTTNADVVFEWRHLASTANHDDYGRLDIIAPTGGVWFWEQERIFAPTVGYENGMTYYFTGGALRKYPQRRRSEFYVNSRGGQVYARLYSQLNTGDFTLSVRGRANASGTRFVDASGGNYKIGVYRSLSADYLNPGVPWWIPIEPERGQVILSDARLRAMATSFPAYFAGHYQSPKDLLEWMANGKLMHDHYVPQYLAKNVSTPPEILHRLVKFEPGWNGWYAKDAQATLDLPEDMKTFLKSK